MNLISLIISSFTFQSMFLGNNHANQLGIFNLNFKILYVYSDCDCFFKIHFKRLEKNGNKTKRIKMYKNIDQ